MPRRKPPRGRRGPPPVEYPKLLCIGGPRDGELLSELDLPLGSVMRGDGAGGFTLRRDQYVRVTRPEGGVWLWQETPES